MFFFLLLFNIETAMGSAAIPLVTLLSLFSLTLSNEELDSNNVLWSSLTPLQLAAMDGRAEEVEAILLEKKESVNCLTGMSALHWGALRGSVPVIGVLLRFGANASSLDDERNTALHMAAVSGNPEAVQQLVLAKVDINARNSNDKTALHLAVSRQDFEVVKKLLRFGARTDIADQEGKSPLDLAVESNNLMITALLRSSGAKKIKYAPKSYTTTTTAPIPTVATTTTTTKRPKVQLPKATRKPELRKLTEKEMELNEAAKTSMDKKIADLCAEGVDPNFADMNNGQTPVHLAASVNGKVALLALARCSFNLNVQDFDGNTPLHIAVMKDFPWAADMLLMLGASPGISNNEGKKPEDLVTPSKNSGFQATFKPERMKWIGDIRTLSDNEENLLRLVQNGYYFSVADSCKEGVDVRVKNVHDKQYTMLHYAVSIKNNIPGTIQMLLRCGADINARDANGNTPLHVAVLEKMEEAQKVLLNNGADQFIANREGKTPHQILKESSPEPRLEWYMSSMPV